MPRSPTPGPAKRGGERFFARPSWTLAGAAALLGVAVVAAIVVPAGPFALDRRWSESMTDVETAALKHVALVFDALGRGLLRGLTLGAVGLVLLLARRFAAVIAFAAAESLAPLVNDAIKALADRPRPPGAMLTAHGSSFPSGHAAYAGATAAALVLLFTARAHRRPLWWAVAVPVVAGMAWSRTYLQVHWLSDVLVGSLAGLAAALASFAAVQLALGRRGG